MLQKRKKKTIEDIIMRPEDVSDCVGSPGILAILFRKMLYDRKINNVTWGALMDSFTKNPRNNIPSTPQEITAARGQIQKEFAKGGLSWKVLCKAMRFFQYYRISITIVGFRKRGLPPITHSITVDLADISEADDLIESSTESERN